MAVVVRTWSEGAGAVVALLAPVVIDVAGWRHSPELLGLARVQIAQLTHCSRRHMHIRRHWLQQTTHAQQTLISALVQVRVLAEQMTSAVIAWLASDE